MDDSEKSKRNDYSPSFDKKLKEARSSKAKGEMITVNPENVWKSIESGLEQHSVEISVKATGFGTIASLSGCDWKKSGVCRGSGFPDSSTLPRLSASDLSFLLLGSTGRIWMKI